MLSNHGRYILTVFLLLCAFSAKGQEYYEVQAEQLNVMANPKPDAQVLGTLKRHDVIEVSSACQGWVRIVYNGAAAYTLYRDLLPLGQGVPYETMSLEAWVMSQSEGRILSEKELKKLRKEEEKVARRSLPKVTVGEFMVLANCAPDVPQFGSTLAYVKKWGFYVRGMFSGGTPSDYNSQTDIALYKKDSETLFSITGGAMYNIAKGLYCYVGAGIGRYGYEMEGYDGDYHRSMTLGARGLTADAGIVAKLGHFLLQGGYNAIMGDSYPSAYKGFYLGLGYSFDIKKRKK